MIIKSAYEKNMYRINMENVETYFPSKSLTGTRRITFVFSSLPNNGVNGVYGTYSQSADWSYKSNEDRDKELKKIDNQVVCQLKK
jgi:hypothetical protein